MTICLAPRGGCVVGDFRSRSSSRVFGRASILASSFLVRRRMTRMPPAGYPALQYLQSVRVRIPQLVPGTAEFLLGVAQALLLPSPLPIGTLLRGDPAEEQGHEQDQEEQSAC